MTAFSGGTDGGFLHLLPTYIPEGMTVSATSVAMLPWLVPSYGAVVGLVAATGEPALGVTFEWPSAWLRTPTELSKHEREWLYLRRFSADQLLATGRHAFGSIEPGPDPPDAIVGTDTGKVGVESTTLTLQQRRSAYALFHTLRQRLLQVDPVAFMKLRGHFVYLWFQEGDELSRPHRSTDIDAADELLRQLAAYEPQTQEMWMPAGSLPEQAPPLPTATTDAGARFYALPLVNAAPGSMLFSIAGFEIGLAYSTVVTASAAWAEVQRLVDQHDSPGVDLLLISAGAPDQRGVVFPAEEAVAEFLLQQSGELRTPANIKQVVLHSWATGRATALLPDRQPLFGPIYQSTVPVHHPLVPSQDPIAGSGETCTEG